MNLIYSIQQVREKVKLGHKLETQLGNTIIKLETQINFVIINLERSKLPSKLDFELGKIALNFEISRLTWYKKAFDLET